MVNEAKDLVNELEMDGDTFLIHRVFLDKKVLEAC